MAQLTMFLTKMTVLTAAGSRITPGGALGIARQRWIDTPTPVTDAGPAESLAPPARNDVSRARKSSIM